MSILLIIAIILIIVVGCALFSGSNSNNPQNSPANTFNKTSGIKWKNCPNCNHRINEVAKKCPYCNYEYPGYSSSNFSYT